MRQTRSIVIFPQSFTLSGYPDALPAGSYEILVEEELLEGISFLAYRRTATWLMVQGTGAMAGRSEQRPITETDLAPALAGADGNGR